MNKPKLKGILKGEYRSNGKLIEQWEKEIEFINEGQNRILNVEFKKQKSITVYPIGFCHK